MHSQLLLQVPDLLLILLEQQLRILLHIDDGLIADLHHPRGELERAYSLLDVIRLRVYIRDHDSLTVPADRVLQEVSQLALPVGDVIAFVIANWDDHLLQERQGLIYIGRLLQVDTLGSRLFSSLTASQIDQMQPREHYFLSWLHAALTFKVDGVDTMTSRGFLIQLMSTDSSVSLSLEQVIQGLLLVVNNIQCESLDMYLALGIILYGDLVAALLMRGCRRYQIEHKLIIDL